MRRIPLEHIVKGAIATGVVLSLISFALVIYLAQSDQKQQEQAAAQETRITKIEFKLDAETRAKVGSNSARIAQQERANLRQDRQLRRIIELLESRGYTVTVVPDTNKEGGTGGGTLRVTPTRGEFSQGNNNKNNRPTTPPAPPSPPSPPPPLACINNICTPDISNLADPFARVRA